MELIDEVLSEESGVSHALSQGLVYCLSVKSRLLSAGTKGGPVTSMHVRDRDRQQIRTEGPVIVLLTPSRDRNQELTRVWLWKAETTGTHGLPWRSLGTLGGTV